MSGGRLSGRGAFVWYNGDRSLPVSLDMWDGSRMESCWWHLGRFEDLGLQVACMYTSANWLFVVVWVLIALERAKSSILANGNFGEFFLWRGNFAFSKREFPVALEPVTSLGLDTEATVETFIHTLSGTRCRSPSSCQKIYDKRSLMWRGISAIWMLPCCPACFVLWHVYCHYCVCFNGK